MSACKTYTLHCYASFCLQVHWIHQLLQNRNFFLGVIIKILYKEYSFFHFIAVCRVFLTSSCFVLTDFFCLILSLWNSPASVSESISPPAEHLHSITVMASYTAGHKWGQMGTKNCLTASPKRRKQRMGKKEEKENKKCRRWRTEKWKQTECAKF